MDFREFRDAMFPWFEYEHAPRSIETLNELLSQPSVRERANSLNVRYLVNVSGGTESDKGFPGFLCGGPPGLPGCFGAGWQEKTSRIKAVVWDIAQGTETGRLAAQSKGKSVNVGVIVPFIFVAYTEDDACKALAADLGRMLDGTAEAPKLE